MWFSPGFNSKSLALILLVNIFTTHLLWSQSRQSIQNINKVGRDIRKGRLDKAEKRTLELQIEYPTFLRVEIHNIIPSIIMENQKHGNTFVHRLSELQNPELDTLLRFQRQWIAFREGALTIRDWKAIAKSYTHYDDALLPMYALAVVADYLEQDDYKLTQKNALCNELIRRIHALKSTGKLTALQQRECNYWMAYAYFFKALDAKLAQQKEYLRLAALYEPDLTDHVLYWTRNPNYNLINRRRINASEGFKGYYQKFLQENHLQEDDLATVTQFALRYPSEDYLAELRRVYQKDHPGGDFLTYWLQAVEKDRLDLGVDSLYLQNAPPIPVAELAGKWILVDFWGTWCKPCLKDLPRVQELQEQIDAGQFPQLEILTLATHSPDLATFMNRKKYTFPAYQVQSQTSQNLNIQAFPTKFLISPNGKRIPVKNFLALDWSTFVLNYLTGGESN